jgi:hypothetical protein
VSWLRATIVRVIRTGAQAALASIGAAVAFSQIAWDEVAGVTGLAMLISFLMALTGLPETPEPAPLENVGDAGQVQWPIVALLLVGAFLLGALCYSNGILIGD